MRWRRGDNRVAVVQFCDRAGSVKGKVVTIGLVKTVRQETLSAIHRDAALREV